MKKLILIPAVLIATSMAMTAFIIPFNHPYATNATIAAVPAGKWTVDKAHSNVKFSVTHLVVSQVEGYFRIFDGSMVNTKEDLSDAKINFTVDIASVNTDNERRDNDLKSDNFFSAEKYPSMKFESSSIKPMGDNKYKLTGNLTIRDVTKPVDFDLTYGGSIEAMGRTKIGFKAKTTINRFDYNLKWDKATETGNLVVGKDVDITVNVEMNKEKV